MNRNAWHYETEINGTNRTEVSMPQEKVAMTLSSNAYDIPFFYVLQSVISIYFGDPNEMPQFKPLKPFLKLGSEELEPFLGTYSDPDFPFKIKVFKDGDRLMAQATDQDAFEVNSIEENRFKSFEEMITLDFILEENQMQLEQLGRPSVLLTKGN